MCITRSTFIDKMKECYRYGTPYAMVMSEPVLAKFIRWCDKNDPVVSETIRKTGKVFGVIVAIMHTEEQPVFMAVREEEYNRLVEGNEASPAVVSTPCCTLPATWSLIGSKKSENEENLLRVAVISAESITGLKERVSRHARQGYGAVGPATFGRDAFGKDVWVVIMELDDQGDR